MKLMLFFRINTKPDVTILDSIVETIYQYYPRGITREDGEACMTAKEALLRKNKFNKAKLQNSNWLDFKSALLQNLLPEITRTSDYSVFGNGPAYSVAFAIHDVPEALGNIEILVLISVISDFWSYRFVDKSSVPDYRYTVKYKEEKKKIELIDSLIKIHFPQHQLLKKEFHQVKVNEICTFYSDEPTVFQALFAE
jgi:hypothetical protein